MLIFFIIFLFLGLLSLIPNKGSGTFFYALSFIILVILSGLRGDIDNDYNSYIKAFENFGSFNDYFRNYSINSYFEPFYYLIPSVYKEFNYNNYTPIFILFALFGVSSKFTAINLLSKQTGLCLLTYFSYFFLLHEMTQIRVGIASGILLCSLYYVEKKAFIPFLLLLILASCFHYSSILFIVVYFLNSKSINKKLWLIILLTPILIYFLKINFINVISVLRLGVLSDKLIIYQNMFELGEFAEKVNVFNIRILVQIFFISILLLKIDLFVDKNKYSIILLKCLIISISLFFVFSPLPVFAFRLQELFAVTQIIAYPLVFFLFKERYFGVIIIFTIALLTLLFNLYYLQLLKPYF